VRELKQPGGVATGVRLDATNGMRLALLLKAAPHVRRIYVPYTRSDASAQASLGQVQGIQAALGVELLLRPMTDGEPAAAAIDGLPAEAQAMFLLQDSRLEARVDDFVAAAVRRRLPLSVPSLWQVERGALMSFGFDLYECGYQAGRIAARVLAGESPAHLPVETASNRLWLNLRAAEQIGLRLPDALLRQAHRILR
jgi:putative ABC transport system substrate-binding protein